LERRLPNRYDQINYPSKLHPQAQPDRLATMGRLFGVDTPAVQTCRILELGCGEGGNLIPSAFSLPGARFLGIDLSEVAVNRAQNAIRELGLPNVEARQLDICNLPTDIGSFDYIIAHGVFSWVPPHVRERILLLCRELLTPNGVVYISYNAYPGCRMREIVREATKFMVSQADGQSDVEQSRKALDEITALSPAGDAYGALLRAEAQRISEVESSVLFHDDLSPINQAFYLHEFVAKAREHDLQYLSDADYADTTDRVVHPGLAKLLDERGGGDLIRREQISDFVRGRSFRRTLLCHANVTLQRPASPKRLRGMHVASAARPIVPVSISDVTQFKTAKGATVTTNHSLARTVLSRLADAWPRSVVFEELLGVKDTSVAQDSLGEFLLTAAAAGAVEFRTHVPEMAAAPGERPLASALARWQANRGPLVTTLAGATVKLEGSVARNLLLLLDGTRDRREIVEQLGNLVEAGQLSPNEGGAPITPARAKERLAAVLDNKLLDVALLGLLVR
jgi:methyltransferase-like protein/trans-aconitate methyltransferase